MGSFENDVMRGLAYALRDTDGLKETIKGFNANIETFKKIAFELERANSLKELELGLISVQEYADSRAIQHFSQKKGK